MYLKVLEVTLDENQIERLFVTDDAELAMEYQTEGEAVLIYLHDGNREQDFSAFPYVVEEPEAIDVNYAKRIIQRSLRLPWTILETERLLVRETVEEDAEAFVELYRDPQVSCRMEPLTECREGSMCEAQQEETECHAKAVPREGLRDLQEQISAYRKNMYGFYEFGIWTVVEKATGQIIGRAGIEMHEEAEAPDLGYMIGVKWQGKGYATEACQAILNYAREELGLEKLLAFVQPENGASLGLCNKLGFAVEKMVVRKGVEYCQLKLDMNM